MSRFARARLGVAAIALLAGLAACDSVGNMFSPGSPASDAPARLALQASIPRFQQSAFTRLELRVVAQYVRANQSLAPLGSQLLALSSATTQQVPVSIELGSCLSDAQRLDAAVEPAGCVVTLALTLIGDGRALDSFQLPNLRLVPGTAAPAPAPVQLFEIAAVSITVAGGGSPPPGGIPVVAGSSVALGAEVFDGSGAAVTGRTINWSSANTAVATVSATGLVTGVSAGSSVITATVGGRSATTSVVVAPPTQRLEIVAVPGDGTGRVVSSPTGIDCTLSNGVRSGTCGFDFAGGASVTLTAVGQSPTTALFNGWTGACLPNGSTPNCTVQMNGPRSAGGSFAALAQLQIGPGATYPGITVLSSTPSAVPGQLFNCDLTGFVGNCALPFRTGTTVSLFAAEDGIARITSWIGCDSSTRSTCEVDLGSAPRSVEVQGTLGNVIRANLVDPTGLGRVTAANVGGSVLREPLNCGTAVLPAQEVCASGYPAGSTITVSAIESPSNRFLGWSDPDCSQVVDFDCIIRNTTGDGTEIVLDFGFEPNPFRLTLTLNGSGGGTVFDQQGNPLCTLGVTESTNQCEITFPASTLLSLGAQPAGAGQFLGFGGDCSGLGCLITVDQPRNVTAEFTDTPALVPITIAAESNNVGFGFVVSDNNDIECDVIQTSVSGVCTTTRAVGSVMTITAFDDEQILTPSNHVFTRWAPGSPCAGSTEPVCTFVVPPLPSVATATFVPASEVSVDLGGSGSLAGTLTASTFGFRSLTPCTYQSGINPAACIYLLPTGSAVTLAVTPSSGTVDTSSANFCSWVGNASCSFVLTQDESGFIFIF